MTDQKVVRAQESLVVGGVEVGRHDMSLVFGDMDTAQFDELVENIKNHGLENPQIIMCEGGNLPEVIDGWHRCRAAVKLGISEQLEPRMIDMSDPRDAIKLVAKLNLHRRHLTPGQRALSIVLLTSAYNADDNSVDWNLTLAESAAAAGVSEKTIQRARREETERQTGAPSAHPGGAPPTAGEDAGDSAPSEPSATASESAPEAPDGGPSAVEQHNAAVGAVVGAADASPPAATPADASTTAPTPAATPAAKQGKLGHVELTQLDMARAEIETLKDRIAVCAEKPTKAQEARIESLGTMRSQRDTYMRRHSSAATEIKSLRAEKKKLVAAAAKSEKARSKAAGETVAAKAEVKSLKAAYAKQGKSLDKALKELAKTEPTPDLSLSKSAQAGKAPGKRARKTAPKK